MYAKRVQIINYGPIEELVVDFTFEGDSHKPVLLVGGNGSGKSIFLSHVVNGLASAKDIAFPETPEVETGKVFKVRSPHYIRPGSDWYFAKVDFEHDLFMGEITARGIKREYQSTPPDFSCTDAKVAWDQMGEDQNSQIVSNINRNNMIKIKDIFSKNCVLYFPANRFEEPAWLNGENLKAPAEYMDLKHVQGYSNRRMISYSPLRDNQNWLFDVAYDRAVFETRTINFPLPVQDGQSASLPIQIGPSGNATTVYGIALQIVQRVMRNNQSARFGIGQRLNRVVSLEGAAGNIVPNIFQLSSGETSLLNLFLCILRDFDLSDAPLINAAEIRGIVVVDEIDLHLHAVHQHEVLPGLMRMFPKVQFVVTTHSPLFVLGMAETFGEDGFALHRMPEGHRISPEEFSEFGDAYRAFTTTSTFADDLKMAIREAQSPMLYMEGKTDIKYLQKAAQLLGKEETLAGIMIEDGNGSGRLTSIWKGLTQISDSLVSRKVMVLFDCEYPAEADTKGNRFKRKNPRLIGHPVDKGIENLFSKATLDKALAHNKAFVDIEPGGTAIYGGEEQTIADKWAVNQSQKTNLCNWLCENGSVGDFQHFGVIFDLLEEAFGDPNDQECSSA